MRTRILTLATFIIVGLSACKKDKQTPSDAITGQWRWVKSVGGIGGLTITPQSTGYNFRDEFYADSTFKRFENDSLIAQQRFSITRDFQYTPSEKIDVLKTGTFSQSIIIRNDTLYMVDLYISDGFADTYVRIK
jgi:hypothetical protein